MWEELGALVYRYCQGSRSVIAFVEGRRYAEKLACPGAAHLQRLVDFPHINPKLHGGRGAQKPQPSIP